VMSLVSGHFHPGQSPDVPVAEPIDRLDEVPFLQGSENALRAIGALIRYAEFQRARAAGADPAQRRVVPQEVGERARALVRAAGARALTERQGKEILALYGIRATRERLATNVEEALQAAREIGYPLVLKVESADILHKTDVGAVLLDVRDPKTLVEGFERVVANARQAVPAATISGVLVQEMVERGVEMILGMTRDPQFGPVIACGLGGVFVETLEDVQLLLPPVSEADATAAIQRLRGHRILRGVRGQPPRDIPALVNLLRRFSNLCDDLGDSVREIDVNPLVVFESGRGACAVDCLIVPSTVNPNPERERGG
jgi:acetate---CoA ligase (ADP-forming)